MTVFFDNLKIHLDAVHKWPAAYLFKFVIPEQRKAELMAIIPTGLVQEKWSKNGNYVSVSLKTRMNSSDEVIHVYERASHIQGLIAL